MHRCGFGGDVGVSPQYFRVRYETALVPVALHAPLTPQRTILVSGRANERLVCDGRSVRGPAEWSFERAKLDVLNSQLVPKKAKREIPDRVMDVLQPPDLRNAWADLQSRVPVLWKPRSNAIVAYAPILLVTTPDLFTPCARSKGRTSRQILIPRGFVWLLLSFGHVMEDVRDPWIKSFRQARAGQPKEIVYADEMYARLRRHTKNHFSTQHTIGPELAESLRSLRTVMDDPRCAANAARLEGEQSPPSWNTRHLVFDALRFVLAHEMGHHLLNHLDPQTDVADLHVLDAVEAWVDELGLDRPMGMPSNVEREWWCDAFALMILTSRSAADDINEIPAHAEDQDSEGAARPRGQASDADEALPRQDASAPTPKGGSQHLQPTPSSPEHAPWWTTTALTGGASVALLALHVAGELIGTDDSPKKVTHPDVETRLELVATAMTLHGRRLPRPDLYDQRLGRPIAADAGLYGFQTFGVATAVLELMRQHPGPQ